MLLASLKSRYEGGTETAQKCEFESYSDLCQAIQSGFLLTQAWTPEGEEGWREGSFGCRGVWRVCATRSPAVTRHNGRQVASKLHDLRVENGLE